LVGGERMKVKLIIEGGNMKPGPAVAQQLGPMGINMGKVIEDVNKETAGFKGTKVPIELDVDSTTKEYKITVFSPPMSELIKKEMGLEKASGASGSEWAGNIAFEQIVGVAKTKMSGLLAKDLRAAVRLAVGSCVSMGILVDSKNPIEIEQDISDGKYDTEISGEVSEVSAEKKKELDDYFKDVKSAQDKKKKVAEAEKAAEEEKKAEAAKEVDAEGAAAPGAAGADAKAGDAKKEEPKKDLKKK